LHLENGSRARRSARSSWRRPSTARGSFQAGAPIAPRSDPSKTLVAPPLFKVDAVDNGRGQQLTRQLPEGRCGANPRRLSASREARRGNGRRFMPAGKGAGEAARRHDDWTKAYRRRPTMPGIAASSRQAPRYSAQKIQTPCGGNGRGGTIGTERTYRGNLAMSAFGGKADIYCSDRVCLLMTQLRHRRANFAVTHNTSQKRDSDR
jgi:hypothetical protein